MAGVNGSSEAARALNARLQQNLKILISGLRVQEQRITAFSRQNQDSDTETILRSCRTAVASVTEAMADIKFVCDRLEAYAQRLESMGGDAAAPFSSSGKHIAVELSATVQSYFADIREKSDVKDTLADAPFCVSDLRLLSPEETALMRDEFALKKNALKRQWEEAHHRPWPKYESDVYIINSEGDRVRIRKAGMDFDAHHIQSLSLGGKNEVFNLTPLSADVHFDHKGIHKLGSPYDQMSKILGGTDCDT